MTDARQLQSIKVVVENARGASFAEIARRTGSVGGQIVAPTDSDQMVLDKQVSAAKAQADAASLSAATAAGFVDGTLYPTTSAGLAASANGDYFTVVGDGTNTYAILYRKVSGAAVEQARYASKAAYEGASGAGLIGTQRAITGAVVRSVGNILDELPVSVTDLGAIGDGVADDGAAFNAWVAYIRATGRRGFIPDGVYRFTAPQIWRPRTTPGVPAHSLTIFGESMDGVILYFDYADDAPCLDINPPYDLTDPAGYTGLESGYIGGFTVEEKNGQHHTSMMRCYNAFNTVFENIRLRPNGARPVGNPSEYYFEALRVTSAMQWAIFRNIIVDPYNAGTPANPYGQQSYWGTGISIGNGYRDGPKTNQYAISSNKFYGCRVYHCHFGFLTEAADGTTFYDPVSVQNDFNYVERASFTTTYLNPWDEGSRMEGFVFDQTVVEDSTGTSMRKTQYPMLINGYNSTIRLAGVVGANIQAAMNLMTVEAAAQRCHGLVLGQDSVVIMDDNTDSKFRYFRTSDNRHVQTIGGFENSYETPAGDKLLTLSAAKGVGLVLKTGIEPTVPNEMVFQKVSDTQVTMRLRGADGVVRNLAGIAGGTLTFA